MIWSYSFLRDLANCPHKAFRKFIKRDLPKEDSPALRDGNTTHSLLESYLKTGGKTRLPVELEAHAAPLARVGALAEVKLGMTEDMRPAGFSDEPWGRGKLDVLLIDPPNAVLFDWKTGKTREDDHELRLQSLLLRANHPDVTHVEGAYVWLKEGRMGKWRDLSDVNDTYHATVASVAEAKGYEAAGDWPCTPNALCAYCPVHDCMFNTVDTSANSAMVTHGR